MNQNESEVESNFFDQELPPVGPSTSQWQQLADRLRGVDESDPLRMPQSRASEAIIRRLGQKAMGKTGVKVRPQPDEQPESGPQPSRQQYIRRRIGAAALALGLGIGTAVFVGPKVVDFFRKHPYSVEDRTPTEEEICAIRRTDNKALLVVAAEFTNDLSTRRGAANRINQAIRDQDDDRFAVCYNPQKDYSRVLTDEAVENLPPERLVSWADFPGRADR